MGGSAQSIAFGLGLGAKVKFGALQGEASLGSLTAMGYTRNLSGTERYWYAAASGPGAKIKLFDFGVGGTFGKVESRYGGNIRGVQDASEDGWFLTTGFSKSAKSRVNDFDISPIDSSIGGSVNLGLLEIKGSFDPLNALSLYFFGD